MVGALASTKIGAPICRSACRCWIVARPVRRSRDKTSSPADRSSCPCCTTVGGGMRRSSAPPRSSAVLSGPSSDHKRSGRRMRWLATGHTAGRQHHSTDAGEPGSLPARRSAARAPGRRPTSAAVVEVDLPAGQHDDCRGTRSSADCHPAGMMPSARRRRSHPCTVWRGTP
jgi:hypothetical protein